ncbi:MAG: FHA domain-containing protein [Isosphaeraceae bacterium]
MSGWCAARVPRYEFQETAHAPSATGRARRHCRHPARGLETVGRDPSCNVRLNSSRVSRFHCCLAPGIKEVVVRDLGSTNGLRINGEPVIEGVLRPGDELAIAHLRFRGPVPMPSLLAPPAPSAMQDFADDSEASDPGSQTDRKTNP